MTVEQARQRCGDKARLSCCNDATYTGDDTKVNSGVVSDVLGAGAGSQGVGLFSGCSKLDLSLNILLLLGVQDLLNQECKQNVACCQKSGGSADEDAVGLQLPCIGLGSII
ncbi:uncharacterized protein BDW47DRAFT_125896 [Aspergillus candidus]|uniref:Hydrophobin n=1 Tax=Aspergillus candidus TaxID=41067 RepID=A0A2I2FBA6_ASPCN|nr:hypothetical protein BDW47DRAFT_125896 [Aspergillus candidus]PLB37909.1 hypothetical protein BDW47DRAFT_125896 [Aspergillus candidus]